MDNYIYRAELENMRPYVPGRPIEDVKREYGLDTVIKLASNENPYGCSPEVKKAVIRSLEEPSYYPDGNCTKLRAIMAGALDIETGQLIFGCGTDEIISMLGKAFIDKGDECLTGAITFSQYEASIKSMGGVLVSVPMKNHGFDLSGILDRITEKTKIIFIANPNNPTGTVFSQKEQEAFIEKVPDNILIAFDEAYSEFVLQNDYPQTLAMMKKHKNIILMKTFSKAYGLASFRVGYAIADAGVIALMERIRNPFNVSVQAQEAAAAAFLDQDFVRETAQKNREVLDNFQAALDDMGIAYIPSHANFIMIHINKPSNAAFNELMKKGYTVRSGAALGMENWLRVSIGTKEQMTGFLKALQSVL